jgi:hypothetical protein
MDGFESFFQVPGIEPDEWVLADLGAMDGLDSDLVDGAFATLSFLGSSPRTRECQKEQKEPKKRCRGETDFRIQSGGPLLFSLLPERLRKKGRTEIRPGWLNSQPVRTTKR